MVNSITSKVVAAVPIEGAISRWRRYYRAVRRTRRRNSRLRFRIMVVIAVFWLSIVLGVCVPPIISQAPRSKTLLTNLLFLSESTDSIPRYYSR